MIRVAIFVMARFFLSAIFLTSSVGKILNWHEAEKTLASAFCDWQDYVGFMGPMQVFFAVLLPWAPILLIFSTLLELIGGLLVLLGVHERWGAFLLILFLIPTTLVMHPFWFFEGGIKELQTWMFLKNLSILGGLLLVALEGAQGKKGFSSNLDF